MERQRTEADPEELLDDALLADPAQIERARAKADEAPPAGATPAELADFYFHRARAARAAGREKQALADLKHAATLAEKAPAADRSAILAALARTEASLGRPLQAIRHLQDAMAANPPERRGRLIPLHASLVELFAAVGDLDGAERAFTEAKAVLDSLGRRGRRGIDAAPMRSSGIHVLRAESTLLEVKGQYAEAEQAHRRLIAAIDEIPALAQIPLALSRRLALSRNLILQDRLAEAENEARRTLVTAQERYGTGSRRTASALLVLAKVLSAQGRHEEGETLVRSAVDLLKGTGLSGAGRVQVALADVLVARERWTEALAAFELARSGLNRDDRDEFAALTARSPAYPLALLKNDRAAEARDLLATLHGRNQRALGDNNPATAESRALLAMALQALGETDRALAEFAAAVPILLGRAPAADDDSGSASAREQRLRLILDSYLDLLADQFERKADRDTPIEAFRIADAARGRSVARALAAFAARSSAAGAEQAGLARREQDLGKQIAALNSVLANAISAHADQQDADAIKRLTARIGGLNQERGQLAQDLIRRFPGYTKLAEPPTVTVAETQAALRPDEALLAFYVTDRRTYLWVVRSQGPIGFVAVDLPRADLGRRIDAIRKALEPDATTWDGIPPFPLADAHGLYRLLLQAQEGIWGGATTLYVVPHGDLAQIPLALLPTEPPASEAATDREIRFGGYRHVPWLLRRAAIAQLPNVGALATLRALPPGSRDRRPFVGFADPAFSPAPAEAAASGAATEVALRAEGAQMRNRPRTEARFTATLASLPRLPDTAEEIRAIADALGVDPATNLFIGAGASEAAVRRLPLADWRVVMFATHGLVPGDLAGLVQPALALSAPESGGPGDGLLTMEEVLGLKLNADWVVLSACNTASGRGAGAEAVSGLGRAFFYAGARALLVSNWPVETVSARKLTTDLFRRQAADPRLGRAEALRQAMLNLADHDGVRGDDGRLRISYAHPIFWAPFALVGDGGATTAR